MTNMEIFNLQYLQNANQHFTQPVLKVNMLKGCLWSRRKMSYVTYIYTYICNLYDIYTVTDIDISKMRFRIGEQLKV